MPQASTSRHDTKLPRAILRQSARLAQLEDERKAALAPPSAQPAPPGGNPDPGEPKTTAETPPTPPANPREDDPAYWKQRFQATAGTLNAVKEERLAERREWNVRFAEQQATIEDLKSKVSASTPPDEIDVTAFFSADEIEKYGEEQCRIMAATAQRTAQVQVKKAMDAALQPLRQRQEQEARDDAAQRRARFEEALTERLPNWREIDADDNAPWHAWLTEVNPDTGETHNDTLTRFVTRNDAAGTAGVFSKFLKLTATTSAPTPPVAPPSAGSGEAPAPPAPPAHTPGTGYPSSQEIKDYYKAAALGKLKTEAIVAFEARLKLPRP